LRRAAVFFIHGNWPLIFSLMRRCEKYFYFHGLGFFWQVKAADFYKAARNLLN
jgi:hypothetical protein